MATEAEQAVQCAPTLAFIDRRFQDVLATDPVLASEAVLHWKLPDAPVLALQRAAARDSG